MRDTNTPKTINETLKDSLIQHSAEARHTWSFALGKMLYDLRLQARRNPGMETLDEAADAFWSASDIADREAYVEIRDLMRKALREMAERQIGYKHAMHQRGGNQAAQNALFDWRPEISMLIALRRAGKRWSAAQVAAKAAAE